VNSEELEQSLRTEFESYLKNVLADMRQEVSEFQKQFEAEFEKHKAQIDEVFQNFSSRMSVDRELDASFTDSVMEHLRLSRDEGARITAMAIAEAEELEKQTAAETVAETVEVAQPAVSYSELRDAINDISSKNTQSSILKTLVHHAAQFTPRGAFFIIKNEHFVGWRVFGKNGETVDEHTVREVFFPVASSTVLGESVRSLSAVESTYGTYDDDSIYLNKLEFGHPDKMYAVPLVVRGRSVAVLYADNDDQAEEVNIEAIETLVRVASLTVEILASSRGAQTQAEETAPQSEGGYEEPANEKTFESQTALTQEEAPVEEQSEEPVAEENQEEYAPVAEDSYHFTDHNVEEPSDETPATEETSEETSYETANKEDYFSKPIEQPTDSFETNDYESSHEGDSFAFKPSRDENFVPEESDEKAEEVVMQDDETQEETSTSESEPGWNQTTETDDYYSNEPSVSYETPSYETTSPSYEFAEQQSQNYETAVAEAETEYAASSSEYQFETTQSYEAPQAEFESTPQTFETPSYEVPQYQAESYAPSNGVSYDSGVTETSQTVEAPVAAVSDSAATQPAKSRFSDRNVDLPIEVSEDERRLHNDARRFARLLVSEIKLYNEQKVKEGREAGDLYERLREAIDRSREMYDKRVQPPVAAKFDYFHYELVSNLAEGDAAKLGASYPGAGV